MEYTQQRPVGLQAKPPIPVRVRYCLYARKSTEEEDKQILSIGSQIKEMEKMAQAENLEIVVTKQESHSAKEAGARPVFNEIVDEIKQKKFDGILTWAPDRISRNAGDLGRIVDLMDQGLLKEIRTFGGQKFTNNPNEKFLLMILGSQAKLENDNKVINVKRGLRARCEMGLWPAPAPVGYLNSKNKDEKCVVHVDPHRAPIIKKMFEKVAYEKYSGRKVHRWLKEEIKFTTKSGKPLTLGNIYLTLRCHFYYGTFEYPKKSGEWYTGKHAPIITRELFDKVQENIAEHSMTNYGKEFAFTKLITCGLCGSGVTADEKFKKQLTGKVHHYIYYGCGRHKDQHCKSGYIREEDLIEQLAILIDKLDLDEIGMKQKIKEEIEHHRKFQSGLLGEKPKIIKTTDIDIRNYAKYILRDGALFQKREMLTCLKSKITLANKKISIF